MDLYPDADRIVRSAIARACRGNPDSLDLERSLPDLGIDSLTLASIAAELEMICGMELPEPQLQGLLESRSAREFIRVAQAFLSNARSA